MHARIRMCLTIALLMVTHECTRGESRGKKERRENAEPIDFSCRSRAYLREISVLLNFAGFPDRPTFIREMLKRIAGISRDVTR